MDRKAELEKMYQQYCMQLGDMEVQKARLMAVVGKLDEKYASIIASEKAAADAAQAEVKEEVKAE